MFMAALFQVLTLENGYTDSDKFNKWSATRRQKRNKLVTQATPRMNL